MAAAFGAYSDLPFAFFGHSMGSLISFELARRLRRERQQEPIHLFVSGRSAPQLPDEEPPAHNLPEPEFLEELRRLNGTPKEALAYPELMQILIPILRADFSVCETYIYTEEPPLACPISAFGGTQDSDVSREDMEAWRRQTRASFTLRMFSGDHFFLHSAEEQLLTILAEEISHLARKESTARPTRFADFAAFDL